MDDGQNNYVKQLYNHRSRLMTVYTESVELAVLAALQKTRKEEETVDMMHKLCKLTWRIGEWC